MTFVYRFKILVTTLFSLSAFADGAQFYSWEVRDVIHPLWEALNDVPIKTDESGNLVRRLEGLICVQQLRPLITKCELQKFLDPRSSFVIYSHLNVEEVGTNANHLKVKVLGPLIVRGDFSKVQEQANWRYNLSKIYFNHPCQYVHDNQQATRCLGFWSRRIFISYEDWNKASIADQLKAKEGIPLVAELVFGKEEQHRVQNLIHHLNYFSVVLEYQGESDIHIYYLGLKEGVGYIPVIIEKVKMLDIPWAIRVRLLERAEKEKVPVKELADEFRSQLDDFIDKVAFRAPAAPFLEFKARLKQAIEDELAKLK